MNETERIKHTFSQVNAPDDTLERVYDKVNRHSNKSVRSFTAKIAIIAAVLVLSCVGVFAAAKFGISSHVLPSANSTTQGDTVSAGSQTANGFLITMPFGDRKPADKYDAHHDGIDFAAPKGTPVLAAADGTVAEVGFNTVDGNYVQIRHTGGYLTFYKCLDGYTVATGDTIAQGDQIGTVGSTGRSTGPHLHFELQKDGTPINPALYFTE